MAKNSATPTKTRKPRSPSSPKIRVVSDGNGTTRLVRARSDKLAIAYCTGAWTSHKASADEVAELSTQGVKLEYASDTTETAASV